MPVRNYHMSKVQILVSGFILLLIASCGQAPELSTLPDSPKAAESGETTLRAQAIDTGLGLPFPPGNPGWMISGGPHVLFDGTYNSIDLQLAGSTNPDVIGVDTLAMGDGDLIPLREVGGINGNRDCGVLINHSNGLQTVYWHLIASRPRGRVTKGEVVGRYMSINENNARNCFYTEGPHVHIALYTANASGIGNPVNIQNYSFSGWQPYSDGARYSGGIRRISDGYSVGAGTGARVVWYGNVGCYPNCPVVTQNPTSEMIAKSGATTSLNFNTGVNVFNLWGTNPNDGDQLWDIFKPGQFNGGNAGWMVRRKGTNTCLNSYRPSLTNGVRPNPFTCDATDGDQQWDFNDKGSGDWEIKLRGTSYCLDAPDSSQSAALVMNGCNGGASQKWKIPAAVVTGPVVVNPPTGACADPGLTVATWDETPGDFIKLGLYPQYWWREGSNGGGGGSTFTYSVAGATENYAEWNLRPPESAIYDLWIYTPAPTEDTRPLGNYGSQTPVEGVSYTFHNRDVGGAQIGGVVGVNQVRGCWQKLQVNLTLAAGTTYFVRLGDHANQADRKIYFDAVGLKKVGDLPDTTVPTVSIASPSEGQTVGSSTLAVSGSAGDNRAVTGLQYVLNGAAAVPIPAGTGFNFNVTLNPGSNTIKVIAGDAAGNTASVTRTVTFTGTPLWQPNKSGLQFTDTIGGGAATSQTFTLGNAGNGTGSYSISSNQTWLSANPSSGSLAANANATISVTVTDCTAVSNDTGTLTISGSGLSVVVNVTRACTMTAPIAPTPSSITMSSNGRIFIAWPEVSGATQYDFQATFNGAAISVTGQAPNRGGAIGSAVATFLSAPDAADKQGKQVCFSMRATNTGGSSAFSGFACTTYKYYAGGLSVQSSSDVPRLTLK
jgi:hypothetical protein